jgi:hypothetical protein
MAYRYYLDKVFEYADLNEAIRAYPGDPVLDPLLRAQLNLSCGTGTASSNRPLEGLLGPSDPGRQSVCDPD